MNKEPKRYQCSNSRKSCEPFCNHSTPHIFNEDCIVDSCQFALLDKIGECQLVVKGGQNENVNSITQVQ